MDAPPPERLPAKQPVKGVGAAADRGWLVPRTDAERWRSAMSARAVLLVVGLVAFIGHVLDPGTFGLDAEGLALLALLVLIALAPILRDFSLPGGGGGTIIDGARDAAEALDRSESGRGHEIVDTTAVEELNVVPSDDLADVQDLANHVPHEALSALRSEMSARLRRLDQALIGGPSPVSDYEIVRRLVKGGVIDQDLAAAAYSVLGATERGGRQRDVPVEAVRELIEVADRLLRDLASSASPALSFERHVRNVLYEMAGRDRVIREPGDTADFRIRNTLVEVKYVRPGGPSKVVVARAARQLSGYLNDGTRGLIVVNDEADVTRDELDGISVKRLSELSPDDLDLSYAT